MNDLTKQRIEQVSRGEVPEKYRKRASGIVPCDWAEYSLGEIYKERKLAGDPKLPILTVSIHSGVSDGALNEEELGKKVKRIEDKTQYKTAKAGDLVFNMMRAWQGAIGVAHSDGLVSPAYIVAQPEREVFPLFMDYYMKQPRMVNMIHRQSYGVTDFRLRLYWDSFAQIQISLPPIAEQKRIVEILSAQDKVIELFEKKVEQLQLLKKSYMQKMFLQPGNDKPEIRFPGFTDAWEQHKLGDVFHEYSEKKHEELPPLTIIQGTGTILREESDRNLQYDKGSLSNYKMVRKDDFIVHLRSFEGGLEKANSDGIISPAYHTFHGDNTDTRFYYPFFRSWRFIDVLLKPHVYGIRDGKSIDIDGMKTIDIPVPSYEEQKTIGGFIELLDNLIALHQRKRDEEVRKKQALMLLLLTGIVRV